MSRSESQYTEVSRGTTNMGETNNPVTISKNLCTSSWISLQGAENRKNLFLDFVRDFTYEGVVTDHSSDGSSKSSNGLNLCITAVSAFSVFLNGRFIGKGPAPSYPTRWYYHTFRLQAESLIIGNNRLTVVVHHDGAKTKTTQKFSYGNPGLIAWGDLSAFDTSGEWMVRYSPRYSGESQLSRWGFYKEFYHGDREDRWQEPGDPLDQQWQNAHVLAPAESKDFIQKLQPLDLPPLETMVLEPAEITGYQNNGGTIHLPLTGNSLPWKGNAISIQGGPTGSLPEITLDFGRMTVGYPEITVSGSFSIYEVWYGETLDTYRSEVVRTGSSGVWKAFHRRAFRYLKLRFLAMDGPITLESVRTEHTWYSYPKGGKLVTANSQWNKLIEVSLNTLKLNTSYHFEDCPGREQALWIFDLRVMARLSYFYCADTDLVKKNLLQMMALQREDGSIPATGPKDNICHLIDFCFHLVASWREYVDFSGDTVVVQQIHSGLLKLHTFIQRFTDSDGLVWNYGVPEWGVFIDWSDKVYKPGKSVILNSLYCEYLENMAYLNQLVGQSGSDYLNMKEKVASRTVELLWNPEKGLFADSFDQGQRIEHYSFQGNFAAMYAGLCTSTQAESIRTTIFSQPQTYPPPYGPSFYQIVFDAMARYGFVQDILPQVQRYWMKMLDRGATTWWEVFDPDSPNWSYPNPFLGNVPTYEMDWIPISSCHGWSGAPAYALPAYILGVDLSNLGQKKITVQPNYVPELGDVHYSIPLAGELLTLHYRDTGESWEVMLESVPGNITVELKN